MRLKIESIFTRKTLALGLSLFLAGGLLGSNSTLAQAPAASTQMKAPCVPNQLLVMARKGADKDEINTALHDANGTILKTMSNGRLTCYVVEVPAGKQEETMKKLSKDKAHFDRVQTNVLVRRDFIPNDPAFPQQYHLPLMNVPDGYDRGGSGNNFTVGIIDSGVWSTNNDLAGRVDPGLNTITGGPGNTDPTFAPPGQFRYHGTFVSTCGFAATNNGIQGAAPAFGCRIIPVDVFNGAPFTDDAEIIEAMFYLEDRGVRLINMSVGAPVPFTFRNEAVHPALYEVCNDYFQSGGLLFTSAGNDGQFDPSPRTNGQIVSSAINANQVITNFSTRGNCLWFTAPGRNIRSGSGVNINGTSVADGTSFSSPLACSIAAQVWARRPQLKNVQVLNILANTTIIPPNYNVTRHGFGIPNSAGALR